MAENKDQHYVPKMLMKRFANPEHLFSFAVRGKNGIKVITGKPYDNQCQYDYYYGRDKEWERELGRLETMCSPIFDKIDNDLSYYPTNEEIDIIKHFMMAQHSRTPRMVGWEVFNIKRAYVESYRLYKKNTEGSNAVTSTEIEWIEKEKSEEFHEQAKGYMRRLSFEIVKYLSDLECIIVHFDCRKNLVLSDDPVVIVNPFIYSAGFISIGLIMLMPVSSKTLIVFRDPVLFESTERIIISKRDTAVNSINMYQAITFDKELMFYDKNDEEYILDLISKTETKRKEFNRTGEGGVFYGPNDCVIVQHHPTLLTNYPYIFSRMKKEYRKFCFFDTLNYRFQSNRYLERLNNGLPLFASQPLSKIDLKKLPSYIEFTEQYWKLHERYETIKIDIDADKARDEAKDDC